MSEVLMMQCGLNQVDYLGFRLVFQKLFSNANTRKSIAESLETVKYVLDLCKKNNKEMVVYISMGFGNPYEDA